MRIGFACAALNAAGNRNRLPEACGQRIAGQFDQTGRKGVHGGRQGRVSTIPLVKPNALLLIGWGEALKSAKTLIEKLDLPVPPDTQFKVFPLRNASAEEVHTTIQNFFGARRNRHSGQSHRGCPHQFVDRAGIAARSRRGGIARATLGSAAWRGGAAGAGVQAAKLDWPAMWPKCCNKPLAGKGRVPPRS